MNRNKIIMAAIGGVALVLVLAFGYLAFDAWSEAGETRENIAADRDNVNRILSSAVPPTQDSLNLIQANTKSIALWRETAREQLAEGDVTVDRNASATSFKAMMSEDARALSKLPGGAEGKLVRDGFDFGFKSYIIDGNIPAENILPALKRQWAEVKGMVELLSSCGIVELQSVEVAAAEAKVEEPKEAPKPKFGKKRPQQAEPVKPAYETMDYTVRFTARPLAVVKTLNAFAASEHLMYVRDVALVREKDMLGDVLGLGKKDQDAGARSSRRRRGRAKAEEQPAEGAEGEEVSRKGLVTDPLIESPFIVTLKVQTIDFGTNGDATAEKPAENGAKTEQKEEEE